MYNAGYRIIRIERYSLTHAIVMGEIDISSGKKYVTWDSRPEENHFFWGHYFTDKTEALRDYHTRLMTQYNEQCNK